MGRFVIRIGKMENIANFFVYMFQGYGYWVSEGREGTEKELDEQKVLSFQNR